MYKRNSRTDRRFNKSREWLYTEYVTKNRSLKEVARDCGLTSAGLKSTLAKYNIRKPKLEIPVSELKQYLLEGKSVDGIRVIYNCSRNVIYRLMKKHNLTINYKPDYKQYDDNKDKLICAMYLDGISPKDIAKEVGLSHTAIINHLKHCNIPLRTMSEAQWKYMNRDFPSDLQDYNKVYDLYVTQRISKEDLGIRYNVDPSTINRVLRGFNIPIRNNSEAKIGYKIGEAHPNWQGGITPLYARLRQAFQVQLEPLAKERDNNTCQICGSNENLCVHHKKPFIDIVKEIKDEHPTLDIKENVNELYSIAVNDNKFRDLNNLITCCKDCHLYVLHGFTRK